MRNIVYLVEVVGRGYLNEEFNYLQNARKYAKRISKQYKCKVYLSYVGGEIYRNGKQE